MQVTNVIYFFFQNEASSDVYPSFNLDNDMGGKKKDKDAILKMDNLDKGSGPNGFVNTAFESSESSNENDTESDDVFDESSDEAKNHRAGPLPVKSVEIQEPETELKAKRKSKKE